MRHLLKWLGRLVAMAVILGGIALFVGYWRSTNDFDRLTAAQGDVMRAIVHQDYGSPDVLQLRQLAKPVPDDNQVLVKVHAASVNPLDWHFLRGTPYIGRPAMGLRKPALIQLGTDYAGTVEAAGKNVTEFKPGDEVFGGKNGAFADYVCARPDRGMARKPANISFEQAAAVPVAGVTALQALRDIAKVQAGQAVLVNGASGGVGTFAVQIAKTMGANVAAVCSTRNIELVRSIGADQAIDYTKEDFTKSGQRYDAIIDTVGNHPLLEVGRVLQTTSTDVIVGGPAGQWLSPIDLVLKAFVLSPFVHQKMKFFMAEMRKSDLAILADLIESGKITPVLDRSYPLDQVADALRYLEAGHARGKVTIKID